VNPNLAEKGHAELAFWESRLKQQNPLRNDHFEYFYTTHFGLNREFYRGMKILDIGCGPRGSLEWATDADLRIGLDPLADAYRKLGIDRHTMQYVASSAEEIPFPDESFDIVSSFNSLDHVDDLDAVITEISRVLRASGHFLLISDIHHHPTTLEPTAFSWDVVAKFQPSLQVVKERHFEYTVKSEDGFGDIYGSLRRGIPYDHTDPTERYGILSARFRKPGSSGE